MLAMLGPSPRAKPVVMVMGVWGEVNHPLVTGGARSRRLTANVYFKEFKAIPSEQWSKLCNSSRDGICTNSSTK